ncbi:DUF4247 domain-containing protein [Corynebacterium lowii]|uniref:DUF4247 domain-containing protein n=1 Tax=Corynebacterium lowii TaxID=1544413 RepID=A0A0Q0YWE2_9CORY|nr:DUF4247 domain-containing protein [Corynebacterium lowii]KQB86683.1 hypothetical protein Clow_00891 [Corynebacterium lowii]MDP9851368.1 hypothetical protein [Corynebacterium lowii]
MKSSSYYFASLCCLLLAAVAFIFMSNQDSSVASGIPKNYERAAGDTFYCQGTPEEVADEIEQKIKPAQSRATDQSTGSVYLRYEHNLVEISGQGEECRINLEDLNRVNGGSFIYLGPGFRPASPSSSSGGSSGSGSGAGSVK